MVRVNGNGLYSTPTGFTPGVTPSGPDLTGTYQWNATYSGDDNNNAASDIDDPTEQVTVNPGTPPHSPTPAPAGGPPGPPRATHGGAILAGGLNATGDMSRT